MEKSHICDHLQNCPDWKLPYDGYLIEDEIFKLTLRVCNKCFLDMKKHSGIKIINYPLSMPNAEKNRLNQKVPF